MIPNLLISLFGRPNLQVVVGLMAAVAMLGLLADNTYKAGQIERYKSDLAVLEKSYKMVKDRADLADKLILERDNLIKTLRKRTPLHQLAKADPDAKNWLATPVPLSVLRELRAHTAPAR